MLYSILCIRKHLNYLNSRVGAYCGANNLWIQDEKVSKVYLHNRKPMSDALNNKRIRLNRAAKSLDVNQGDRTIALIDAIFPVESANHQRVPLDPKIEHDSDSENTGTESRLVISNLHDFDIHLSRLNLFIKEVDIDNSLVVFIAILYHCGMLLRTVFIYREFSIGPRHITYIVYNFIGLLPPLTLFTFSTLMEREARNLMTKLEYLYLQEETQCFMYRQMSGMKYPLLSIFDLLGSIQFNCDQLMHLSLGTMLDLMILLLGCTFVVIQYGK